MPTVKASGSQAATLSTEHTLATVTDAGTYVLAVDTAPLVGAEILELRVYVKVLGGSTSWLFAVGNSATLQGDPVKMSIPVPTTHEFKATLKQIGGTGRTFDWEVIAL